MSAMCAAERMITLSYWPGFRFLKACAVTAPANPYGPGDAMHAIIGSCNSGASAEAKYPCTVFSSVSGSAG